LQLLTDSILAKENQTKLINLLQFWVDDDNATEQKETGEYLIQVLDEDRLSNRQLFPAEMKGITW
jgi:hypothetical protein